MSPTVVPVPESGYLTVIEGQGVTLECEAAGNPLPAVIWSKDEGIPVKSTTTCPRSTCLLIPEARKESAGVYRCLADNGVGVPSASTLSLVVECTISIDKILPTSIFI